MSTKWSDPSCTVCCIMTDAAVLVVCTLASIPVRYRDWLETNAECRVFDIRIWWSLTSFAVGDGTVDAMVCQTWHKPLVNLSRHCKTSSTLFSELHQIGYWWHCVSSLSLMILHTSFMAFYCTSASAYTRNKVTINMALTLSQSQYHGNIIVLFML